YGQAMAKKRPLTDYEQFTDKSQDQIKIMALFHSVSPFLYSYHNVSPYHKNFHGPCQGRLSKRAKKNNNGKDEMRPASSERIES
ncbi:MAG: hypothetical protein E7F13_05315, partial [Megasphaera sp.]|nr:hypothetical protein [Megasphaera sp.]